MTSSSYIFKYIIIGDISNHHLGIIPNNHKLDVGKTCLMNQFIDHQFTKTEPTVGVEYRSKEINLQGKSVTLQIWDTVCNSIPYT